MSDVQGAVEGGPKTASPEIREINRKDVWEAFRLGLADFNEKPSHIIFLCLIYPIVAFFIVRFTFHYDILPLLFPVAAGYALIGPLAATGLYEISRRIEEGRNVSWKHAFGVLKSPSLGALIIMGSLLMVIFIAWLAAAALIYDRFMVDTPDSILEFIISILTTEQGWKLIIVGCGVGFLFAVVTLAIAVVSFPMLLDRKVTAGVALKTSVRAFLKNPQTMLVWGFFVAGLLVLGTLPLFVGLAVVLPVLGHSTWHLYRRTVVR